MSDRSCEGCEFWRPYSGFHEGRGECRRRAPTYTDEDSRNNWPVTEKTAWCGEFKKFGADDDL